MLMIPVLASVLLAPATAPASAPPPTTVETVVDTMHGDQIADDYRWLEALEADDERVEAWTTQQHEYTRSILDNLPGREELSKRIGALMTVGSVSAPHMRGNLYFYTERAGDQNQPILFVRKGPNGEPRQLLDPNTLDDRGLFALDWFNPSHDGKLLAFGLSHAGDEMTVLHIMDVHSGMWLADEISGKVEFGGWAPDNHSFLYGQLEDPSDAYSRSIRFHIIGRHARQDPMLFMQEAPSRIPDASLSRNGRWVVLLQFEGWSKQDVQVLDMERWRRTGDIEFADVAVGLNARFLPSEIHGDTLYLLTTLNAPNGMLYGVDLNQPGQEHWRVVIPERADAVLGGVSLAGSVLCATYEKDASTHFKLYTQDGDSIGELPTPGLGTASIRARFDRSEAFMQYESFNEPDSIYRVDIATGARELWARPDVPVDPDQVVVKQEWCTSKDGTKVPMFIVHRKGLKKNGKNPLLVYGYGGFNASMTPWFSAHSFAWYEGGGIWVTANIRGGSEYGESWHRAGMLESKQNVYDDLYAVAEHLVAEGYSSSDNMVVYGGSNGGLLTGVAAMQRPDLWAGVVSAVPLLDMLRYQHFLMAKFWIPEYGDPENAEHYQWLKAYSPYHNIKDGQKYPSIFFTAGENDNRVHPLHARKMTAALQARSSNDPAKDPILLWVDREGGHGQGKPLHLRIQERVDLWSYIMWRSGMTSIDE